MTKKSAEILAPAGSIEQLVTAVNNGCDSVYLGLDAFNARMKAPNFTLENIGEWIDFCHLFGVKVYVAINTSLKNNEFEIACNMLKEVYRRNADGVILTDTALIYMASRLPKPFEIVASTQLNVHDRFGAEFVKELGATTVVCARECSMNDIRDIASTGIKTECFIHGATCVCQSGQCLFSSLVGGNSGNRGLCAQPCRKKYVANNGATGYLLSARDLCGMDIAENLSQSGASVFKIEGRNRRAEYAGATSRIYKKLFENAFEYDTADMEMLEEMYNRSNGKLSYLNGDNADIVETKTQNHIGVAVGYVKGKGFVANRPVAKGDGLKVLHDGREVCGGVANESGSGFIRADFSSKVQNGMEVRRTTSIELCNEINSARRTLTVDLAFYAYPDKKATLKARHGDVQVEYTSDFIVQSATNKPTSTAEIVEQLQKTGNSHHTISDIDMDLGDIFLAKSQINAMRRGALQLLDEEIIKQYNGRLNRSFVFDDALKPKFQETTQRKYGVSVVCRTEEQLQKASSVNGYAVYKPSLINSESLAIAQKHVAFVDIPSFADGEYLAELLSNIPVGIVCHHVGHVQLARKSGVPYIAGSGLNLYNDKIVQCFSDAVSFVYSLELTLSEIAKFRNQSGLIYADGELTLMKLVHCPYKLIYACDCENCKANVQLKYTDEQGNEFFIKRRRDKRCTFELVNGKKLSVCSKLNFAGNYLVDFDEKVIAHYTALNNKTIDGYTETKPFTKGRLYDKVN